MSRVFIASLFAAAAHARFGQEQGNGAITAIGALTDLGQSGQAATLAGGSIQFLLAAANPCAKLSQADEIIAQLGTSDAAVAAARGLVAAEQNFNPFVVSIPSICSDPSLPASPELRGVVPLIDPAVGGADIENALSATSIVTPFDATGLSVAQVMVAQGFSNFTAVDLSGNKQPASALGGAAAPASPAVGTGAASASAGVVATSVAAVASSAVASGCGAVQTTFVTVTATAGAEAAATSVADVVATSAAAEGAEGAAATGVAAAAGARATSDPVTGTFEGFVASSDPNLDFGECVPTMKFEAGLNGRRETESTFQAIDPLVNKGQQEALNPAIIMNRIKDQLTNVCGANQAAKDAAVAALATVSATGVRDVTAADQWNSLLGFAGANTNPDNAPQAGLVGHT